MASTFDTDTKRHNGPPAAALLAGGIGAATLGIVTTLSEASTSIANALNWYNPVGPLTGKVLITVAVYFLSWILLGIAWKDKDVNFGGIATLSFILLAIGLLGTFPPVFEIFAGG